MDGTARQARTAPRDEGMASIELVILFPALLLLITALLQYGLWFHARSVALAAAQEGVAAARALDGTTGAGGTAAIAFVEAHGGGSLLEATATATRLSAGEVEVEVSGQSQSVIPGVAGIPVHQVAAAPVERFVGVTAP